MSKCRTCRGDYFQLPYGDNATIAAFMCEDCLRKAMRKFNEAHMKPYTKNEYQAKLEESLETYVQRANNVLMLARSTPVNIDARELGVPPALRDKFILVFQGAGWTVRLSTDQRDGDYWIFS